MLDASHYSALYASYFAAMAGSLIATRTARRAWPKFVSPTFSHPWREFGYALLAAIGVIVVGQFYQRGIRLPSSSAFGPLAECVNQTLIFSPMVVLLVVRRHSPSTAWLPTRNVGVHLATGVLLAALAVLVFTLVRGGTASWPVVMERLAYPSNVDKFVQVFLEDFAIAMILVRLGAALGKPARAAIVVSALFAAGHIPAMMTNSATADELTHLLLDFGLGVFVLLTVQRTGSIWWFCWVHFAMDMMQFDRIVSPATAGL